MNVLKRTVIAALLLGGIAACGTAEESAANYIESGKALLADGKPQKARLEFKNAIQIDPRMAEPFYQPSFVLSLCLIQACYLYLRHHPSSSERYSRLL